MREERFMRFKNLNLLEKMWIFLTILTILLNLLFKYNSGIVSYGIYFSDICIGCCLVQKNKINVNKKWLFIAIILFFSGILSSFNGEKVFSGVLNEFQRHVFYSLLFSLSLVVNWEKLISENMIFIFMKSIYCIGLLASMYALFFQGHNIPSILFENSYEGYEAFKSFFSQRNVFACCLLFSSFTMVYLFEYTKKKKYLFLLVIFAIEIYLCNSRASLLAFVIAICVYIYEKTRKNAFLFFLSALVLAFMICYIIIPIYYSINHVASYTGITSEQVRLTNWSLGLNELREQNAFLIGFGMGSEMIFLTRFVAFGSFHNVYMDIFFQGGIIKLIIYILALVNLWKKINKCQNNSIRISLTASFLAYIIYSFVESGAMLFSISYFSLLSTCMFCVIPQANIKEIE